jgi:hypothetical protein
MAGSGSPFVALLRPASAPCVTSCCLPILAVLNASGHQVSGHDLARNAPPSTRCCRPARGRAGWVPRAAAVVRQPAAAPARDAVTRRRHHRARPPRCRAGVPIGPAAGAVSVAPGRVEAGVVRMGRGTVEVGRAGVHHQQVAVRAAQVRTYRRAGRPPRRPSSLPCGRAIEGPQPVNGMEQVRAPPKSAGSPVSRRERGERGCPRGRRSRYSAPKRCC